MKLQKVPEAICVLCTSNLHTLERLQDHVRRAVCYERPETNGNDEAMTDSHVNHSGHTDDGEHDGGNEGGNELLLFDGEFAPPDELVDIAANLDHANLNFDAPANDMMADVPNLAPSPDVAQILADLLGPYPPAPQPINAPPAILTNNQQATPFILGQRLRIGEVSNIIK